MVQWNLHCPSTTAVWNRSAFNKHGRGGFCIQEITVQVFNATINSKITHYVVLIFCTLSWIAQSIECVMQSNNSSTSLKYACRQHFHAAAFKDREGLGCRQGYTITAVLQNALHYMHMSLVRSSENAEHQANNIMKAVGQSYCSLQHYMLEQLFPTLPYHCFSCLVPTQFITLLLFTLYSFQSKKLLYSCLYACQGRGSFTILQSVVTTTFWWFHLTGAGLAACYTLSALLTV